jgi:TonB dependent receptor
VPRCPRMWVTPSAASRGWRALRAIVAAGLLVAAPNASVWGQDTTAPSSDPTPASYSARARATATTPAASELSSEEARTLSRHMGPSFSYVESLPGVVPVFSGVPYLMVRGATPAGSLSFYDGIPVPTLFHLALGPSLIEPELTGETRFFAGIAPAQYAAHVGGVMEVVGPDAYLLSKPTRSLQLSVLDASGLLHVPTDDGALTVSWRFGNPGLILRALNLDATLDYHDYQIRYQTRLSANTQLTLVLLGAGDHLGERTAPADDISLAFQRVLARVTSRVAATELGAQLLLSSDNSTLGQELDGRALRASEALYAQWNSPHWRVRAGAELSSVLVKLDRGASVSSTAQSSFARARGLALDPSDFLDGQPFRDTPTRNFLGAYAQLHWLPVPALHFELGLRGDAFLAGSHMDSALSPLLRAQYRVSPALDLHAGIALTHRPHTSPVPLPGLNDIALDRGLESAIQTEAGASVRLGELAQLEATAFYNRYRDTVYLELILDCQGNTDPNAVGPGLTSICRRDGLPTANGESYGVELFLKRDLTERLSGYISYTLGFAQAVARDGTSFTPQSDVRHLANVVLQYDLGKGFGLGMRMQYRTGKMATNTLPDLQTRSLVREQVRLPGFLRLDLRASYAFAVSFGRLEASIGLQNATFSREATKRDCYDGPDPIHDGYNCQVYYQPYIVLPNVGLRADF